MKSLNFLPQLLAVALSCIFLSSHATVPDSELVGSLQGEFAVSPMGAATYTIPIEVPPGIAGVSPKLALTYDSQSGNGLLGVGWSLSGLSAITRCPTTLVQDGFIDGVDFDDNDKFCLDGQRLVAVSGTYGADGTEYRTEINNFSKIVSYDVAGSGPAWFRVWTKSGDVLDYGATSDSSAEIDGQNTKHQWALNKVSDASKNYLTIRYEKSQEEGNLYPITIEYVGNTSTLISPFNRVEFEYDSRSDHYPIFVDGLRSTYKKRMEKIVTYSGSKPVLQYQFLYEYSNEGLNKLTSVSLCSYEGQCLPALEFGWVDHDAISLHQVPGANTGISGTLSSAAVDLSRFKLGDFNGDGITDIYLVQGWNNANNQDKIYLFNSDGEFSEIDGLYTGIGGSLESASIDISRIKFGDFNGDGITDVYLAGC